MLVSFGYIDELAGWLRKPSSRYEHNFPNE